MQIVLLLSPAPPQKMSGRGHREGGALPPVSQETRLRHWDIPDLSILVLCICCVDVYVLF